MVLVPAQHTPTSHYCSYMRAMPVAVFAAVAFIDSIKTMHSSWPLCQWVSKFLMSGPDASIKDVDVHTSACAGTHALAGTHQSELRYIKGATTGRRLAQVGPMSLSNTRRLPACQPGDLLLLCRLILSTGSAPLYV